MCRHQIIKKNCPYDIQSYFRGIIEESRDRRIRQTVFHDYRSPDPTLKIRKAHSLEFEEFSETDGNYLTEEPRPFKCPHQGTQYRRRYQFEIHSAQKSGRGNLTTNYGPTNCGNFDGIRNNTFFFYKPPRPTKYCRPYIGRKLDWTTMMIYYEHDHRKEEFNEFGNFTARRLENFVVVPDIGLAGHVSRIYDLSNSTQIFQRTARKHCTSWITDM